MRVNLGRKSGNVMRCVEPERGETAAKPGSLQSARALRTKHMDTCRQRRGGSQRPVLGGKT